MPRICRALLESILLLACLACSCRLMAATFQQPTPAELSMTSAPEAPGAAGVYLFREELEDDKFHWQNSYVRLKVLTEEGRKYADIELPALEKGFFRIDSIDGRTIHSDGTVIKFTGKPIDKLIVKTRGVQYQAKVFSMPDVQVGSIIEYRYSLSYDPNYAISPLWVVQQDLPVRNAHYHFLPSTRMLEGAHNETLVNQLAFVPVLPPGVEVQYQHASQSFDLKIQNVPPLADEEYMPPVGSLSYRVRFYYTGAKKADEFWKEEGKYWSRDVDKFAASNQKITDAVQRTVQPSDSEQQKIAKIYEAVMLLDNTSFDRQHTAEENKDEGIKIKTAGDIWQQKRGDDDEIALLFLAMVRAAGLRAYAMEVTDRDSAIFQSDLLSMKQLDDYIAIVVTDGKEQFFDPGQRYCPLGQLHWKHTLTDGLRQTESGTGISQSPGLDYKSNAVERFADLALAADGKLTGSLRIKMTGADALKWRQQALTADAAATEKDYETTLQGEMPAGVEIKINHLIGLSEDKTPLTATFEVSGTLGTSTAKRMFLTSSFFEGAGKPLFAHEKRELPVDLLYPSQITDQVSIKLPQGLDAESVPKAARLSMPRRAIYAAACKVEGGKLTEERAMVLASSLYDVKDYAELRDFYQKVNAQDKEQVVFKTTATAAGQ